MILLIIILILLFGGGGSYWGNQPWGPGGGAGIGLGTILVILLILHLPGFFWLARNTFVRRRFSNACRFLVLVADGDLVPVWVMARSAGGRTAISVSHVSSRPRSTVPAVRIPGLACVWRSLGRPGKREVVLFLTTISIPLARDAYDRLVALLPKKGVSISRENGYSAISGHGIVAECEYDGGYLHVTVLSKPRWISEASAEATVRGWFKE